MVSLTQNVLLWWQAVYHMMVGHHGAATNEAHLTKAVADAMGTAFPKVLKVFLLTSAVNPTDH